MNDDVRAETTAPMVPSVRVSIRKLIVVALVLGVSLVAIGFTPLKDYLQNIQQVKAAVHDGGPAAVALAGLVIAVLVALGCPRLLLCGAAGALFGFTTGFLVSMAGQMVGSYTTFLFVRWTGIHAATARLQGRPWLEALFRAHSPMAVFVLRQLPITTVVMNALLSVTRVRHRDFLVGTVLGYVPQGAAATLIGSGFGEGSEETAKMVVQWSLALVCLLASAAIAWRVRRRLQRDGLGEAETNSE